MDDAPTPTDKLNADDDDDNDDDDCVDGKGTSEQDLRAILQTLSLNIFHGSAGKVPGLCVMLQRCNTPNPDKVWGYNLTKGVL